MPAKLDVAERKVLIEVERKLHTGITRERIRAIPAGRPLSAARQRGATRDAIVSRSAFLQLESDTGKVLDVIRPVLPPRGLDRGTTVGDIPAGNPSVPVEHRSRVIQPNGRHGVRLAHNAFQVPD